MPSPGGNGGSLNLRQTSTSLLGRLAGDPLCWYFWGRAGLSTADVTSVLPGANLRLGESRIANVVVQAGAGTTTALKSEDFVAIPVLPIRAATPGADGDRVSDLDQLNQGSG
jgi:hypothetical protein